MALYWWFMIGGFGLMTFGLRQALRNRALGGESTNDDMRVAARRGQRLMATGSMVSLIGLLLWLRS